MTSISSGISTSICQRRPIISSKWSFELEIVTPKSESLVVNSSKTTHLKTEKHEFASSDVK